MRGVRLNFAETESLLNTLDEHEHECDRSRRMAQRQPLREYGVLLYRESTPAAFRVVTRNISTSGVAILFCQFMHTGEVIRLVMVDRASGEWIDREARVVRCRYVGHGVHEIGAAFCAPARRATTSAIVSTRSLQTAPPPRRRTEPAA